MADLGYVLSELRSIPPELRPTFVRLFTHLLKDLRFGHPKGEAPDPLLNFGGGFLEGTTPAVANTEFTIAHGFGRVPYLLVPCLPLDVVGAQIVPLTVTRAADDNRVYLKSSVVNAPLTVIVEG